MKLPKTTKIAGMTYKVCTDKSHNGGKGNTGTQIIEVGNRFGQKDRQFATFVHEIAESACYERRMVFTSEDHVPMFLMNHQQFEVLTDDIAAALYPMVKNK